MLPLIARGLLRTPALIAPAIAQAFSAVQFDLSFLLTDKACDDIISSLIDILKIDIEGAEVDLFKGAGDWLNSVDCISIELHGDEAKREIPATLIAAGFELSRHGSLTVAVRKQSRDKP